VIPRIPASGRHRLDSGAPPGGSAIPRAARACAFGLRLRRSWPAVLVLAAALAVADGASSAVLPADTSAVRTSAASNEIDLDRIDIEGRVEQPNVILVPARLDPALQDTSLDRSFKKEIRSGMAGIASPDTFIRRVEPAPSIRNSIKKKRK
jgi:hypothetical protein